MFSHKKNGNSATSRDQKLQKNSSQRKSNSRKIDYQKLEQRRVLNADFGFDGFSLVLDNFVSSENNNGQIEISRSGDDFLFSLSDGVWSGVDSSGGVGASLSGLGSNVLTINDVSGDLTSIFLNDTTADTFDIHFNDFSLDGSVAILGDDGVFGSVTQTAGSSLSISNFAFDVASLTLSESMNDFDFVSGQALDSISIGDANSIQQLELSAESGGIVVQASGDVNIAGDGILLNHSATTLSSGSDILLNIGGALSIESELNAGTGTIRIIAAGDIVQTADGQIIADELGIRQEATEIQPDNDLDSNGLYDVILDDSNRVNQLAIFNAFEGGEIAFENSIDLTIAEVTEQQVGEIVFQQTTGVVSTTDLDVAIAAIDPGDVFLQVGGELLITETIDADQGNVYLIAAGDIHQTADGTILADQLGVRQEAFILLTANPPTDIDNNGRFDIILDDANQVNGFAAYNRFDSGQIVFNNQLNTSIVMLPESGFGKIVFEATDGVSTTSSTVTNGAPSDIWIQSGGFLNIAAPINAGGGSGNVFLIANGDITQSSDGTITAQQLGIRQQATGFDEANDLDLNDRFDIYLNADNVIDSLAIYNGFDGGEVQFNATSSLTIEAIPELSNGELTFAETIGVSTTYTGIAMPNDGPEGDITIVTAGFLQINQAISAGNADICLFSDGDIFQTDDGIIIANELGVVQTGQVLNPDNDLDNNLLYEIILDANNDIDLLAIENRFDMGDVVFADVDEITIAVVTCGESVIKGVQLSGDLTLQADGDINQNPDAPIIAGGDVFLNAGDGVICLTGADCDEDGENDNAFGGVVSAIGSTVEIVVAGDLSVGDITAVDDIYLRAGDGASMGSLFLIGDLATSAGDGQMLLQSDSGIFQQAASSTISTNQLLLGSAEDPDADGGSALLFGANQIENIAAVIQGNMSVRNATDLNIASLQYESVCGTSEAICGIQTGGNLTLLVTGDITQADEVGEGVQILGGSVVVMGHANLTATGMICLTGASCDGDEENDNDFQQSVRAQGTTVEIVDRNDLTVLDITAVNDIYLRSGDGVEGALNEGLLTIAGNLTTSAADGQVLLQSDNGITQNANSMIETRDLLIGSSGDDTEDVDRRNGNVLLVGENQVDRLAAQTDGNLTFHNLIAVDIASLDYSSDCGTEESLDGVVVGNDALAANLTMDVDGDISQSAKVVVFGHANLTADGDICLTGADCDADGANDNDFHLTVTATGDTVELVDRNDLTVLNIDAVDDIYLRSGDGVDGVIGEGQLIILGDLTTTAADGQVLLQSDNGILQDANSVIQTFDLLVGSRGQDVEDIDQRSGNALLIGDNMVQRLAVQLEGNLSFNNVISLEIASLTYESDCDTLETIDGVTVGNDGLPSNLTLTVGGDLTQTAKVVVWGHTNLTADGDICLTGADCDEDGANDNDFVLTVTASGSTVELVDSNDLTVLNIDAIDDIYLRSGDGAVGIVGEGALSITGNLMTSAADGQILLQSDNGITQNAATVIETHQLLIGSSGVTDEDIDQRTGNVILTGDNLVTNLAARIDGNLAFTNARSLNIASLNYESDCETTEMICGVEVGNDVLSANLTLVVNENLGLADPGNLTQSDDGGILGGKVVVWGHANLTADGDICLTGADCDEDNVNDNDFHLTVTASGSAVELVDRNDLTVLDITATDDIYLRSGEGLPGVTGEGVLTVSGNLMTMAADGQVLLQSDNGITQNLTSVISTNQLLVGSSVLEDARAGNVALNGDNLVENIAARIDGDLGFTNAIDLNIANLDYLSDCGTNESICGLEIGNAGLAGNLTLNVTGDLTQSAVDAIEGGKVVVWGDADLNATETICLTGADCDADNENDNDFHQNVSAMGTTVEIVDRNDLNVVNIVATDNIYLRSGDGAAGVLGEGQLTLLGNLIATDVLLQSDNGIVQDANSVIRAENLLLGSQPDGNAELRSGDVLLIGDNEIVNVAAWLDSNLALTNFIDLNIGDLSYQSSCGTDADICGINVLGDLNLILVDSNLDQSAAVVVGGTTAIVVADGNDADIVATGDICLTGGTCDGRAGQLSNGNNDNDFMGTVTASATTVELVDRNDLDVLTILAADDIYLRSGDGVVGVLGEGMLDIRGNLTTTSADGQILLHSDNGIVQQVNTVISTNQLLIGSDGALVDDVDQRTGNVQLTGDNLVENLAARVDGNLTFANAISLNIASLMYQSNCGTMEEICGVEVGNDLLAANLTLNVAGNITQSDINADIMAGKVVVWGHANLDADGHICLTGADCDADGENDNDFHQTVNASGSTVEIADRNDLSVVNITATDDIFLRSGDGEFGVTGEGTLTLNGLLLTTAVDGQVLLQSDRGITQNAASAIQSDQLLIGSEGESPDEIDRRTGDVILIGQNVVNRLAARIDGNLVFNNTVGLTISSLAYDSDCGTMAEICGVQVGESGNPYNLLMTVNGDLNQDTVAGIDGGKIVVYGDSIIVASGNICLTGADCDGDEQNDNNFVRTLWISGGDTVEVVDRNDLHVLSATAENDLRLVAGGAEPIEMGELLIDGNLTSGEQMWLQASNGASQVSGVIQTQDLLLFDTSLSLDSDNDGIADRFDANPFNGANANLNAAADPASGGQDIDSLKHDVVFLGPDPFVTLVADPLIGIADSAVVTFDLNQANRVDNLAADLDGRLIFRNDQSLNFSALDYQSACGTDIGLPGVHVDSLVLEVNNGNLTDSLNTSTIIDKTAELNVDGNIVLGDSNSATVHLTEHFIDRLLVSTVSDAFLTMQADNATLFLNTSIILSDTVVTDTLYIETVVMQGDLKFDVDGVRVIVEAPGDILQTDVAEGTASSILAPQAALVSTQSIQLTQTYFDSVAAESGLDRSESSQQIAPFHENTEIGNTFTGSLADRFTNPLLNGFDNGDGLVHTDIFDVFGPDEEFVDTDFLAGNHDFVQADSVGVIVVNRQELTVGTVNVTNGTNRIVEGIQAHADIYTETTGNHDLIVAEDMGVASQFANITGVAGGDFVFAGGQLERADQAIVNSTSVLLTLDDPSSVASFGNDAFSDLNAQLDLGPDAGLQTFTFTIDNVGAKSFNVLVGWFITGINEVEARTENFQQGVIQAIDNRSTQGLPGEFLLDFAVPDGLLPMTDQVQFVNSLGNLFTLADFDGFAGTVDGYAIRQEGGVGSLIELTNLNNVANSYSDPVLFNDLTRQLAIDFIDGTPFMLSQIFLTNDAKINIFEDGGTTDLNFTQDVLPTRTVVQNPQPIVVDTPGFTVPTPPVFVPEPVELVVTEIPYVESIPIQTKTQPETFFQVRFTEDDDGVYEEEFKWTGDDDDPDAIRAYLENADLATRGWPTTEPGSESKASNWTERIKEGEVRPGLYFIFETTEGQPLDQPVDAVIDRTDLENLPESEQRSSGGADPDADTIPLDSSTSWLEYYRDQQSVTVPPIVASLDGDQMDQLVLNEAAIEMQAFDEFLPLEFDSLEDCGESDLGRSRFSSATQGALLGSSLLFAKFSVSESKSSEIKKLAEMKSQSPRRNLFSRGSRLLRRSARHEKRIP